MLFNIGLAALTGLLTSLPGPLRPPSTGQQPPRTNTTIMVLGRTATVIDDTRTRLDLPGVRVLSGTGIDDLRSALAQEKIDHVIMGAGLALDIRLAIVREVFETSTATTVHMKDSSSGPEGLAPFVNAVVTGLRRIPRPQ
ncbi:hypothetical protein [Nocardia sp. NPDC052566]|uniref:hypothetical protein n=1 Tax=Nocardia sp. NPDC052566 TaxID=3364330 RepID=UPI0037CA5CA5